VKRQHAAVLGIDHARMDRDFTGVTFAPDGMTLDQWCATRGPELPGSGERHLWATVLEDAARSFLTLGHSAEAREASRWIHSSANGFPSFIWMCSLFDLDPDVVRSTLERRRRAELYRLRGAA
jgi:hypothetical protein